MPIKWSNREPQAQPATDLAPVAPEAPEAPDSGAPAPDNLVAGFAGPESVGRGLEKAGWSQGKRIAVLAAIAEHAEEPTDQIAAIEKLDETVETARRQVGMDPDSLASLGSIRVWQWAARQGLLDRLRAGDIDALRIAVASGAVTGVSVPEPVSAPTAAVQINHWGESLSPEKRARLAELDSLMRLPEATPRQVSATVTPIDRVTADPVPSNPQPTENPDDGSK